MERRLYRPDQRPVGLGHDLDAFRWSLHQNRRSVPDIEYELSACAKMSTNIPQRRTNLARLGQIAEHRKHRDHGIEGRGRVHRDEIADPPIDVEALGGGLLPRDSDHLVGQVNSHNAKPSPRQGQRMSTGAATQIEDPSPLVARDDRLDQVALNAVVLLRIEPVVNMGVVRPERGAQARSTWRTASPTVLCWASVNVRPEGR